MDSSSFPISATENISIISYWSKAWLPPSGSGENNGNQTHDSINYLNIGEFYRLSPSLMYLAFDKLNGNFQLTCLNFLFYTLIFTIKRIV